MTIAPFSVRRATVEDLPSLTALWHQMQLTEPGLDRRLTEFQVAVDGAGALVGAIGFQLCGKQARLHSEGFTDFSLADVVRPLLWDRLQVLAANHGTVRVWSLENAPFWSHNVLSRPDAEALAKLPPAWNQLPGEWLTIKLREDVEEILSLDKEFALFAQSERECSRVVLSQARMLKKAATIGAILLGVAVLVASVYLLLKKPLPPVH
jgi:hypothetical protein